jgi:hypothetical protein
VLTVGVLGALVLAVGNVGAQLPFTTQKTSGQTVTPAFEGWYPQSRRHVHAVVWVLQPQSRPR